ncbi:MAG: extracellular solute-binding protein [Paenibacillaceae bacterium]|nr:extracellular solute-binding protein [Paenibacillaceae bacterium]
MKQVRTTALVAMAAAAALAVTACGGNTGGTSGSGGSSPSVKPSASATASVQPAPTAKKIDLGGQKIRIAANFDDTPKDDSPIGKARIEKQKEVEAKYNVKVEYVNIPQKEIQDKFTTSILAGEPIAEVMRLATSVLPSMGEKGMFLPLEDLTELNNEKNFPLDFMKRVGSYKGKTYGFSTGFGHSFGIYYNKTLFQKNGLTDLHELVDKKGWTWAAFEEVAKKATRDADGDGKIDTWGLSAFAADFAQGLIAANAGEIVDDKGVVQLESANTMEAMNFFSKLFNESKVVRFVNPNDWGEQRKFFTEGNVAMVPGYAYEGADLKKSMTNVKWGYVPFPIGPKATDYASAYSQIPMYFIPKGAKNPKEVLQIWKELQLWDKQAESQMNSWEVWLDNADDIATAKLLSTKTVPVPIAAFPGFPFANMTTSVAKGETTPAAAIAKIKQEAQAKVDAVLK